MPSKDKMKIAVLCNTGPHGWLKEGASAEGDMSFALYKQLASTAERGCLDILFLADGVGIKTLGQSPEELEMLGNAVHFEPSTLLAALSQVTEHVGLVGTISTTYMHPYHIARKVGSLDYLSGGRAGWNVVTSGSFEEAVNFGYDDQVPSAERYARANEAIDAVFALWESFDVDAFARDKATGRYMDVSKMRAPNISGAHFKIKGPLNMPRPPQGRPLISQAGLSPVGHDMAARTADVMYAKFSSLEGGRTFRAQMSEAMARHGRQPQELAVLPGFFPVIGDTEQAARAKFSQVSQYLNDGAGLGLIESFFHIDLSGAKLDEPMPDLPDGTAFGHDAGLLVSRSGRRLTIREVFESLASSYGHISVIGTAEQVADEMELWFREGGADGFNLFLHSMPSSLEDFVDEVVPILQKRGLMQTEYAEGTLREKMGLSRP